MRMTNILIESLFITIIYNYLLFIIIINKFFNIIFSKCDFLIKKI